MQIGWARRSGLFDQTLGQSWAVFVRFGAEIGWAREKGVIGRSLDKDHPRNVYWVGGGAVTLPFNIWQGLLWALGLGERSVGYNTLKPTGPYV